MYAYPIHAHMHTDDNNDVIQGKVCSRGSCMVCVYTGEYITYKLYRRYIHIHVHVQCMEGSHSVRYACSIIQII